MAIYYGGKLIAPNINNLQQTDFSKATAHPEFVAKGKAFYDETGQLREGERYLIDPNIELEEPTVAADFSAGDQVVNASDGKAMLKLTITKPETLIAENIREGVDIGGVVGTFKGQGGDEEDKYLSLTIFATLSNAANGTFTHEIGCAVNGESSVTYHEFGLKCTRTDEPYSVTYETEKVAEIKNLGADDEIAIYTYHGSGAGWNAVSVSSENCVATLDTLDDGMGYDWCISVAEVGDGASVTITYDHDY